MLVNNTSLTKNGPYTRYDPGAPYDDSKKSCLELVIVSVNLFPFVQELFIDKDRLFTPARSTRNKLRLSYKLRLSNPKVLPNPIQPNPQVDLSYPKLPLVTLSYPKLP